MVRRVLAVLVVLRVAGSAWAGCGDGFTLCLPGSLEYAFQQFLGAAGFDLEGAVASMVIGLAGWIVLAMGAMLGYAVLRRGVRWLGRVG